MEAICFAVFYVQKCLLLTFLRLHSTLCALKKEINILIFAL